MTGRFGRGLFSCLGFALRRIRLHDLRHTTATLLKDLGVPARDSMEILGHSRIAVTWRSTPPPTTPAAGTRSSG